MSSIFNNRIGRFLHLHLMGFILWLVCTGALQAQGCGSIEAMRQVELVVRQEYLSSTVVQDLGSDELRLLRNAIFARHGYKFKSKDLRSCFEACSWYHGTRDNVDALLTAIDRDNLRVVQFAERRRMLLAETSPAARGDTVLLNDQEAQMIGLWHMSPHVASGYSERYHFFPSRCVIWYASEMDCSKRLISLRGMWHVEGDQLIITWSHDYRAVGGTMVPTDGMGSCGSDSILENAEFVERRFESVQLERFQVGSTKRVVEDDMERVLLPFRDGYLYRLSTDPTQDIY